MTKINRKGAVGALLDIYELAMLDFAKVIEDIPDHSLTIIFDPLTPDENCKSIQAILSHVVNSGYGYATSIHNLNGNSIKRPEDISFNDQRIPAGFIKCIFLYRKCFFFNSGHRLTTI